MPAEAVSPLPGRKGGKNGGGGVSCLPAKLRASALPTRYSTADGKPDESLPEGGLINPCGLMAWSNFNDTYQMFDEGTGEEVALVTDGLSWSSDARYLYSNTTGANYNSGQQWWMRGGANLTGPMNEDDHFMIWMRPNARPDIYHPWARINRDLQKGTKLRLRVQNR